MPDLPHAAPAASSSRGDWALRRCWLCSQAGIPEDDDLGLCPDCTAALQSDVVLDPLGVLKARKQRAQSAIEQYWNSPVPFTEDEDWETGEEICQSEDPFAVET